MPIKTSHNPLPNNKPLPKDKILDQSKLKAIADDKMNDRKIEIWFSKGRKHCGEKGESAVYQHFLHFPQCFLKGPFLRVVESRDCEVKG